MSNKSLFGVPLGFGGGMSNGPSNQNRNLSKSVDHFSPRNPNSPFSGSPRGRFENDFIPLGFSSPVNPHRNGSTTPTHWKVNRRFNSNNSLNSSGRNGIPYNSSNRFNQNRKGNRDTNPGHAANMSQYFHPSMLEDPWADLESKHSSSIGGRSVGDKLSFASENSSNLSTALSDTEEPVDIQEGEGHISGSEGSA